MAVQNIAVIEQQFALQYIESFEVEDYPGLLRYRCMYEHLVVDAEISDLEDPKDRLTLGGNANGLTFVPAVPLEVTQGIGMFKNFIRTPGEYDVPDYRSAIESQRIHQKQYQIVLIITGGK
jgi:hypothetical protein